jgi:GDP-L-fucose synthase
MTIKELAALVKEIVGFSGDILWDASKPGGTLKKQLDVIRLNEAGWHSKIPLKEGIEAVYRQYCL